MLDKLSNTLKKATDKIANAIFLDKKLVDSIVKDLQRSLIEADVNVQLVLQITQKIKKAALDERIKGIEKKEHILKLLHDELISILGEKREISLSSTKPNIFMMLGLYGAGKCVHAESKIQLANGDIPQIQDLYKTTKEKLPEHKINDGTIINLENESLFAPSFNPTTLEIENKKITHLWKLKKSELIEIKLDNGNDNVIKVTPEHPCFILENGYVKKVRADKITECDYISIPSKIPIKGKTQSLWNEIKNKNLFLYTTSKKAKQYLLQKYSSIKEAHKNLNCRKNYCQLKSDIKKGKIPIELIEKTEDNFISIKWKNSNKQITIPLYLTTEFAEFLGYVVGDGHIEKRYVEITTEDQETISRVIELSKIIFNILPRIQRDKRTKKMVKIKLCSTTLVEIIKIFGLSPGKKGRSLQIPKQIILSPNNIIRAFLKAYFDCDSHPSPKRRFIELTSESKTLIQQISSLLKRFGILSSISKKVIDEKSYSKLTIKAKYAELYADKIGYNIARKKKATDEYKKIGEIQGHGNQDMVPLGKALKAIRMQLGFSIGEIQTNAVHSYGQYEKKGLISKGNLQKLVAFYKRKKIGIFREFLEDISNNNITTEKYSKQFINGTQWHLKNEGLISSQNNQLILTNKGNSSLQLIKNAQKQTESLLSNFEHLSNSSVCWLPIKEINRIKNNKNVVYDLTIEDNHSFIAEGCIVHNTTTISKLALYYAKRGKKVCAVGLDVHRPAASEQLKQLMDKQNIPAFIDPNEKDPIKIWKKHKEQILKHDLIFVDTAGRDALDDSLVTEIESIAKEVKPTETLLVMPADIGQTAKTQASTFKSAVSITGVIITRMDSTAKAGGALTACHEANVPVVFIGTGEKPSDLEHFNPESFLSRLLGMGDLESLMEKIHSVVDQKSLEKTQKNIEEGKLTLRDVQTQLESMESMGSMDKILGMIPGLGKAKIPDQALSTQQEKLKKWKHAINSMTEEEVNNPEILEKQTSRIQRIAKGSGTSTTDIRTLIKQYKILNEMIKNQSAMMEGKLDQRTLQKLARKFGKKGMKGMKF